MTVNKLMVSSNEQLGFIRELKVSQIYRCLPNVVCEMQFYCFQTEQEELGTLAADTLTSLNKGQEKLMEQQEYLKATQQMASQQISNTMRELSR